MCEFRVLEGFQAGLSWRTGLHKRKNFRRAFAGFDRYMWSWVAGNPIRHQWRSLKDYPPFIAEAEAWAKDLKARGFKFLGPTVVYAHMQATGMVNDHAVSCFRHRRPAGARRGATGRLGRVARSTDSRNISLTD